MKSRVSEPQLTQPTTPPDRRRRRYRPFDQPLRCYEPSPLCDGGILGCHALLPQHEPRGWRCPCRFGVSQYANGSSGGVQVTPVATTWTSARGATPYGAPGSRSRAGAGTNRCFPSPLIRVQSFAVTLHRSGFGAAAPGAASWRWRTPPIWSGVRAFKLAPYTGLPARRPHRTT